MVIINLDDIDTISSKIRSARVMLGISQARLAKEAGVSQSTIADLILEEMVSISSKLISIPSPLR
ncbi:MAG: helix-turn-helix transcriptional regulator [Candidatus Micrarchaeota archaeon]